MNVVYPCSGYVIVPNLLRFCIIGFLFITITSTKSHSQQASVPQYSFSAQIRYRGEMDGRFFNYDAKPIFINLLRAQIGAKIIANDDISAFIQIQHSQNLGESNEAAWNGTLDGMSKNLNFRQAYLLWNNAIFEDLSLKLGRMSFLTNTERIIGALDWHNVGRMYDGAVLTYGKKETIQCRGFAFLLGTNELLMTAATAQSPQALTGLDITLPQQDNLNLYLYHDRKNSQQQASTAFQGDINTFRRFTGGVHAQHFFKENNIEYEAEFAYQFGEKDNTTTNTSNSIKAMMGAAYIGYKNKESSIGIGFDYFTGENAGTTDSYERFNHITFTIHKFYGYMDFFPFTVSPNNGIRSAPAIFNSGLISPYLRATYKPNEKTTLYFSTHYFQAEQELFSAAEKFGKSLGMECDAVFDYKISPQLTAQLGASVFIPGEGLKSSNKSVPSRNLGEDLSYWAYSMLTLSL